MFNFEIITNVYDVVNNLDKIPFRVAEGVGDTLSDMKKRVPTTVSKCVRKVYNIKAGEIIPNKSSIGKNPVSKMRISGFTLSTLRFTYTGRLLTPVHFSMSPMAAEANPASPYTLKMRVFKSGGRKKIGQHLAHHTPNGPYSQKSGNILFPTGAKSGSGYSHIPIQRMKPGHRPKGGKPYEKFMTVSMPQMITNEQVAEDIQNQLSELSAKRLSHNIERHLFAG